MTELAFNGDASAERLCQAFADCEPETGTRLLGRQPTEFLEDQLPFIRGYAGTSVNHIEQCRLGDTSGHR